MALIKCSECGAEMSDKAKACPKCKAPNEELKIECPECGEKVKADSKVCPECGYVFVKEKTSTSNFAKKSPIIIALLSFIVIVLVAVVIQKQSFKNDITDSWVLITQSPYNDTVFYKRITLDKDNTAELKIAFFFDDDTIEDSFNGTWKIKGNEIIIDMAGYEVIYEYNKSDDAIYQVSDIDEFPDSLNRMKSYDEYY